MKNKNLSFEYIGKCLLINTFGKKILVIGDLHLGYEEFLNRSGVLVSRHLFDEMISYLEIVFSKTGKVNEIILLGDVKHFFGGVAKQEWSDFNKLTNYLRKKSGKIIIIKGNHDKIIEPIAERAEIEVKEIYIENEICFLHGDKLIESSIEKCKIIIMGHWHPAIVISDGIKNEKYKCFLIGRREKKELIIVPSFFEGSIGTDPRETKLEKLWNINLKKTNIKVVSDEKSLKVLDFGKLGKIDY